MQQKDFSIICSNVYVFNINRKIVIGVDKSTKHGNVTTQSTPTKTCPNVWTPRIAIEVEVDAAVEVIVDNGSPEANCLVLQVYQNYSSSLIGV